VLGSAGIARELGKGIERPSLLRSKRPRLSSPVA